MAPATHQAYRAETRTKAEGYAAMKTFVKYVLLFICFGIGVTAATAGPHDKSAEQIVGELLAAVPIDTPLVVTVTRPDHSQSGT